MERDTISYAIIGAALALIFAALLAGCVGEPRLEVESGDYKQVQGTDEATRTAARAIRSLRIDRAASIALLTLDDGSHITLALATRDRAEWPVGCPTNIYSHYMEVLDIEEPELAIASMRLRDPVLVRDCPAEPEEVVLRAEGEIGGGGGARSESCLIFSRR